MPEAVILIEPDGSIGYANLAAEGLLRSDPAIAVSLGRGGSPEFSIHHPTLRTYRSTIVDIEQNRKVAVIHDVTEARRLEAMRRDLVGDVSHELKTPVAGILATAETLQISMSDDPESSERFVTSLVREAQRLSRLVEDLLDLARVEQHHPAGSIVDMAAVVRREASQALSMAKDKGLSLDIDIDEGIDVLGHEGDLALAVRNLLVNAVRYTEVGGATVRLHRSEPHAVLEVTDSGVGIPTRDLPRIFERFYRVDKARSRETGGTGLGLSIVKHVVERHGGSVTAESSLDQGSVFRLKLPLAQEISATDQ
ncbi:MAG TPA: ATP-binding protein [Actinomycetota bacterium]|nr:ATP-binding protein [Actinomycetota bacterium]